MWHVVIQKGMIDQMIGWQVVSRENLKKEIGHELNFKE